LNMIIYKTIKKYYSNFKKFLIHSHNFNETLQDDVELFLLHKCTDRQRWSICVAILNFLDFYEIGEHQSYKKMLIDVKSDIKMDNIVGSVRSLPAAKDVLAFSWVIENYFSTLETNDINYLKYYPIYLWWEISNLIPMRPSEFCGIERTSLFKENDRYFIQLPRLKQKNNHHKIQIIDKISIPQQIFNQLQEYVSLTEPFGSSDTLISSKSIGFTDYFENRFTYNHFIKVLNNFYEEIVDGKYSAPYEQKIRPGDTRHFAFLNLMRQGYHPVEIARLGGHTSLQAQYHYHQHMEYWVDVEIIQLMQRFNFVQGHNSNSKEGQASSNIFDDEFIREKILKPNDSDFETEVEIGFCTDPEMYCQVDKCFYCEHWKISQDEYLDKKDEIEIELQNCRSDMDRLLDTLKDLYRIALKESMENDFSEINQDFNKDLFYTKSQLDITLNKTLNFSKNLAKRGE
ncbi:site-specific integrase, partial [Paenisporosarcina sp. TG-14]|uniref:site-specific integrase n=1 Tax=Paenisporosarcina sp. TG-14 TaxID=1231057 RepID=UPI00035D4AE7